MKILHGTWIPNSDTQFIQTGNFYLWVETAPTKRKRKTSDSHPGHLSKENLATFLTTQLGIKESNYSPLKNQIETKYFLLPTSNNIPLPSPELTRYLEIEIAAEIELKSWAINCYPLTPVIKLLNDFHFLAQYQGEEFTLGADLLFWYHYTQTFKQIILKDQYIPALKYRELAAKKGRGKKKNHAYEIYPAWEIISEKYKDNLQQYLEYIPPICTAGSDQPQQQMYEPVTLLKHFSESLLQQTITQISFPTVFTKKIIDSFISHCLSNPNSPITWTDTPGLETYQQWQTWKQKIVGVQNNSGFYLGLKLHEATNEHDYWQINFLVIAKQDPSLQLELADYWCLKGNKKKAVKKNFGQDFEKNLLLSLGYAARMYPKIWSGLDTTQPVGLQLTLEEAFSFLSEYAWILEDAGYKVIIPAWWTPKGRQKAKIRLKASSKKSSSSSAQSAGKGYFSLDQVIQYQYELSIGGQAVTSSEWQQLVNAKTSLVKFRGQWMELDQKKMQQMLDFWQAKGAENPEISLMDLLKTSAASEDEIEIEADESLAEMMANLQGKSRLQLVDNLSNLKGQLREYQKRGVAWLQFLESVGLNGCLADDMGLGKSFQVIARLVQEREHQEQIFPTLLIAPTSVLGNWQKEIDKFAPHLRSIIHHGSNRVQEIEDFKTTSLEQDLIITSFTLARKDAKLFNSINWHRIVLDEAQNIKNPKAAQTKAIFKLKAKHRLALTGTPIENRLLDLWSIFNFLNPGYLGKQAQFRKAFEIPIQKNNDPMQSQILKQLVEPFILRRLKTDKQIIKDLPDKVEHKQYCNLTKEQASLYEAVVKEVEKSLEEAEGIQRTGLILSTLMKLKQICNHPQQFLQDDSEFSTTRSHKLERLSEMAEEVIAEGESLLIFTQFTEIGENLQRYLQQNLHYNTYYLHGGTNRNKREKMISEFQDSQTEPSAFVLSIKAGGVGITLTKANHVFHFDRWWNPAVENQATDRAFRIGQEKNVFVHKFVTLGTLEERIDQMIEDKQKIASSIVGNDESWLTQLDNDSFRQLIALNRQTVV